MNDQHFYICKHCGNLVCTIHESGVPLMCCGEPMSELLPNTQECSREKHIPVVTQVGVNLVKVSVGALPHPMEHEHHIEWIYLITKEGSQRKRVPSGKPCEVNFSLLGDEALAALAYCNLHGLWMKTLS